MSEAVTIALPFFGLVLSGYRAVHRADSGKMLRVIVRDVALHPVILATLAGLLWSASGFGLSAFAAGFLSFVGGTAAPAGLFIVGVRLAAKPLRPIGIGAPVLI